MIKLFKNPATYLILVILLSFMLFAVWLPRIYWHDYPVRHEVYGYGSNN